MSLPCTPPLGRASQSAARLLRARSTTSATAQSRPRCTAWCCSTPRASSPRPKRPPVPACRSSSKTSSCLPGVRHPGTWLPAPALRRLRPRQARGVQLQTPRVLPLVRGAAHVAELRSPGRATSSARVPVRQWVLALPIPLRLLLAAQPSLVTSVLQMVHRVITRHLLDRTGLKADEADSGAVTLIQRFGSAANLNIHLHCLVLDGVYRRTEGEPVFVDIPAPTDEELQALLHKIITAADEAADPARPCSSKRRRMVDRATWPTPTPIRMRPARSGRCRRRRVLTALLSARAPGRRCSRCKA